MQKGRKSNTGFKGVTFRKTTGKYQSHFTVPVGGKHVKVHVGTYRTADEAHINRVAVIDSLK